jgi:hypothetical protein
MLLISKYPINTCAWRFRKQPATVLVPAIRSKAFRRRTSARAWQASFQLRVRPVLIKIRLKISQLVLKCIQASTDHDRDPLHPNR